MTCEKITIHVRMYVDMQFILHAYASVVSLSFLLPDDLLYNITSFYNPQVSLATSNIELAFTKMVLDDIHKYNFFTRMYI